jgi:hypothetical protein
VANAFWQGEEDLFAGVHDARELMTNSNPENCKFLQRDFRFTEF